MGRVHGEFFIDSCIKMFKLLTAAALMAVVAADGPPAYGAPPAYHPAPAYAPVEKLPLSHTPTNTVLLMTTQRLTSRRPRLRMLRVRLLDLSPLPFPTAVSRPPPTPLTTTTDSLLRSLMKVPLSTPQSPLLDTDTLPLLTQPVTKFVDRTYTPFLNVKD